MYLKISSLVLCSLYMFIRTAQAYDDEHHMENALRLLEHLAESRQGLVALRSVVDDIDGDLMQKREIQDVDRKRKGLEAMKRILGEMDADLIHEQKRHCVVNLGGHCATESAASVADQWHYLNSPLSPGRKRRDTSLYKKLVSGKITKDMQKTLA